MIIVTVINQDQKFFLRGTTWAFNEDRANKFETMEAAQIAVEKAKKFMAKSIYKNLKYEVMA